MVEFWPDAEARNARDNLKTALASIRSVFREAGLEPDAVVVADRYDVRWLCPVVVDVHAVEQCAPAVAKERARALAACLGDLLPGDYHVWATELRARLLGRFEDILRAELAERPSVELAERLLQIDPYCSVAFEALIDDALGAGKRGEARAYFDRYASALAEVGTVPSAAIEIRIASAAIVKASHERLATAGSDACDVAELLALETELDDDDLAALLDWTLERVVEGTKRLGAIGILVERRPARFADATFEADLGLRMSAGQRQATIARIAQRLALHEEPQSKLRLAVHFANLGRQRDASKASLDAGNSFLTFAAWTSALSAFEEAIARLETVATSPAARRVLCESHFGRGDALFQLGQFLPAVRAFGSALDLADPTDDPTLRASGFVKLGNAFLRLNDTDGAWMAVRQADMNAPECGALAELDAAELVSRLLCSEQRFDEAINTAIAGYGHAVVAGAHRQASVLAQRVAEPLRRLLRFDECAYWTKLQLAAAIVSGPEIEAQALYFTAAVAFARNQLEECAASCREALRILDRVRRRSVSYAVPLGLLQWQCHQSLALVCLRRGRLDEALAECAWLVSSPWVFNTKNCAALTFATLVDVWLASATDDHVGAACAFEQRIAPLGQSEPLYFIDVLTRARLAAIVGPREHALVLLHAAYEATVNAERYMPDQIHISYEKLAVGARGVDDLLAARAAEAARYHYAAVQSAAGGT